MKPGERDRLPELVLGLLPEAETRALNQLLEREPDLRREADELHTLLSTMASGLSPVQPSTQIRSRLMDSVAALAKPTDRFRRFTSPLTRILELSRERVRAILDRIDDPSFWEPGLPGIEIVHFDAGPALAGADAGLLRFQPGASFPRHRHLVGRETTLVLEGTLLDGDARYGPGSIVEHELDSDHVCRASGEAPLLLMVLHYGVVPVF